VSSSGLAALNREMHALVDSGKLAGVTTLVAVEARWFTSTLTENGMSARRPR
jgi:hypothetical protein